MLAAAREVGAVRLALQGRRTGADGDRRQRVVQFQAGQRPPGNPAAGLLTATAIGMLAEVATGYPRLVCEMTVLTVLRTAETSAMAARRLANSGLSTMALIGTGAQSEFQTLTFQASLGIGCVRHFDSGPSAMRRLERDRARLVR